MFYKSFLFFFNSEVLLSDFDHKIRELQGDLQTKRQSTKERKPEQKEGKTKEGKLLFLTVLS